MVVDALAALYINQVCMTKNRARKHRPVIHIMCIKIGESILLFYQQIIVLYRKDTISFMYVYLIPFLY